MVVKATRKQFSKAAQELAKTFETHFASLPPAERKKRERDFDRAVAKVGGSRAKSARSSPPVANRDLSQRLG